MYSSLPRMLPQSLYQSGQARSCCRNKQPPKLSGLKEQRLNHHSCCTSIKGHQGLHSGSDTGTQASRSSHQPCLLPDATPQGKSTQEALTPAARCSGPEVAWATEAHNSPASHTAPPSTRGAAVSPTRACLEGLEIFRV